MVQFLYKASTSAGRILGGASPKPYWPVHFPHALSGSDFDIEVSHDYFVVSSSVGENVVNVFIYLLFPLIGVVTGRHVDLDALDLVPLVYFEG